MAACGNDLQLNSSGSQIVKTLLGDQAQEGRLRLVLTEWSPLEEGFHIYYSSRRQLPTGLRLLIEFIQEARPLGL